MYALRSLTLVLAIIPLVFTAPSAHFPSHTKIAVARRGTKCARNPGSSSKPNSHVSVDPKDDEDPSENDDDNNNSDSPSSTKSSSAKPTKVAVPPSGGSSGGLRALFPVGETTASWSTSKLVSGSLPLSIKTLNPISMMSGLPNEFTTGPDGKQAIKVTYKKGSYRYLHKDGGINIYAQGPGSVNLEQAKEATFSYSVYFEKGFKHNMGGKLFGFYGGDSDSQAQGCSGGRRSPNCWSLRTMFRGGGKGEGYGYFPTTSSANSKLCSAPKYFCNKDFGTSIATGSWTFTSGQWDTVAVRVLLNDIGQANGEFEFYHNGKSVFKGSKVQFRIHEASRFRGIMMQSFFGGNTAVWASPQTQNAWFADMSVSILQKF